MPEAFVRETLRTARAKATMLAGWGNVPGVTINRFCASGIDAEAQAETLAALEQAFVRQGRTGKMGWRSPPIRRRVRSGTCTLIGRVAS